MKSRRRVDRGVSTADDRPLVVSPSSKVSRGDIERRAYERFCERGCEDGRDLDDWLEAERELRSRSQ